MSMKSRMEDMFACTCKCVYVHTVNEITDVELQREDVCKQQHVTAVKQSLLTKDYIWV